MTRRVPTISLPHHADEILGLEETLAAVCRNLLERPLDCRGPFVIPNRELQKPDEARLRRRLRLAT